MFRRCALVHKLANPVVRLRKSILSLSEEMNLPLLPTARKKLSTQLERLKSELAQVKKARLENYNSQYRKKNATKRRVSAKFLYSVKGMDILEKRAKLRHGSADAKYLRQQRYLAKLKGEKK